VIRTVHLAVSSRSGQPILLPTSFECPDNRLLLSGESGAGKTTLIECMAGVSAHRMSGVLDLPGAALLGVQDAQAAFSPYRRLIGQLRDARRFRAKDEWEAELLDNMAALGLRADILSCYPHQLSAGMMKRVLLASLLAAGAPLVLLDEPTAGLDPSVRWSALDLVRRKAPAYVLATHDPELLEAAEVEHRLHLGPGDERWFGPAREFGTVRPEDAPDDSTPRVGPDGEEV